LQQQILADAAGKIHRDTLRVVDPTDSRKLLAQAGSGGGSVGMTGRLNGQRTVEFAFQVSQNRGIHRVLLRKGNDVKVLDFWGAKPCRWRG
jgi:hypothetical protein